MTTLTSFTGTPDDLAAMLRKELEPLVDRVRELEIAAGQRKHVYTVAEVAEQIGYSTKSVREFIREGKIDRMGKKRRLPAAEVTTGSFRIKPDDLDNWLSYF